MDPSFRFKGNIAVVMIIVTYAVVSISWSLFSHVIWEQLSVDPVLIKHLVLVHELLFVLVSSVILYVLVRRYSLRSVWLASFPELTPNPIIEIDPEGKILYINNRGRSLLAGWDKDVLLHPWFAGWQESLEKFRSGAGFLVEREIAHGGRWYLRKMHYIGETRTVRIYGTDITEAKAAAEAVKVSEIKYQQLYDSMMDAFCHVALDGRFLNWNDAFEKMVGYSSDEISRLTYFDLTPEKWHARERCIINEQVLPLGYSVIYEKEYRRNDGAIVPIELRTFLVRDAEGDPSGMWAIIRDIGERRRVENDLKKYREDLEAIVRDRTAALERANQRLSAEVENYRRIERELADSRNYFDNIINRIADPIFVKDREHRWVLVNDMFCAFMGRGRQELIGKSDTDFFPASEAAVFWAKDEEVFLTRQENINEEFFTDGTGKVRTIVTKKTIYADSSGDELIVGIIRDVTDIKHATAELQRAQRQLLQSSKMATIGQLAAGVAHEINNPTAYTINNLTLLSEQVAILRRAYKAYARLEAATLKEDPAGRNEALLEVEEIRERHDMDAVMADFTAMIAECREGAERIKKIVSDLRTFAHIDEGKREPANLKDLTESAVAIVWNEIKMKADLVREYADLPPVMVYPQQLNQVFVNLLVNAVDAIHERGRITLRIYADGEMVCIDVEDTGCGMTEDVQQHLFEPFFTTKPVGQGTGLGLSVIYNIVQRHNGQVSFRTAPGEGTTVTVRIPFQAA